MLQSILVATALPGRSADPPRRAAMLAAAHATAAPEHLTLGMPGWRTLAAQALARIDASAPGLVVLGWHAPGWLGRLRNAWAVATIAHRSTQPVLVVRNAALHPYARVLVTVDFSEAASEAAVDTVRAAVRCAPGAHFTLLHPLDLGVEGYMRRAAVASHVIGRHRRKLRAAARAAFSRFLRKLGLPGVPGVPGVRFALLATPHPEGAAVRAHAAGLQPDLVVVGKPERGLVGCWFGLAAAREALAATQCDVLLVPWLPAAPVDAA